MGISLFLSRKFKIFGFDYDENSGVVITEEIR